MGRGCCSGMCDSYGLVWTAGGGPYLNDILFQGREGSLGNKVMFFRNRSYSTLTGRFMAEDPIPPYQYLIADGNTLYYTDALGLSSQSPMYSIGASVVSSLSDMSLRLSARLALSAVGPLIPKVGIEVIQAGGVPGKWGILWKVWLKNFLVERLGFKLASEVIDSLWLIGL